MWATLHSSITDFDGAGKEVVELDLGFAIGEQMFN